MPVTRRTFFKGRMNKDIDERFLPDGEYRHLENAIVQNSEGSDEGSIQNLYSNKKLTNLNIGINVISLGWYADEYRDKLYWICKSESGCYFIEWDNTSQTASFILKDTRPENSRVFRLKEGFFCTGIEKIISDDINDDLILLTDDNMEPLCINPERAKSYGENGFEEEDIFLIKKPPRTSPSAELTYSNEKSNNIEEDFFLFSYRYQYLDNEWSALSDYTNYKFEPKPYKIDYYTYDNIGMINAFNAIKIGFNTGDKRVKAIQIITKRSNSNALYVIETFNKEKEGFVDNTIKYFTFSNNKIYKVLPEKELDRTFDNVPRRAKALTLIGNRPIFGNYLENYDIKDAQGNDIKINYTLAIDSKRLSIGKNLTTSESSLNSNNIITITNPTNIPLKKGNKLRFSLVIGKKEDNVTVYNNSFEFVFNKDYSDLQNLFLDQDFIDFFSIISNDYSNNQVYAPPSGLTLSSYSSITTFITSINTVGFSITPIKFENTVPEIVDKYLVFTTLCNISLITESSAASCKSNRDFEAGIVYIDKWGRKTTVLTCPNNSIYIPNDKSEYKNRIQVSLTNKAPYWADRYKFVIKTQPLSYQTITVNEYYIDGAFVWIRLEGTDKDKVKEGQYLILKRSPDRVEPKITKTKILAIESKEKNFISIGSTGINEPSGLYLKIRPADFVMKKDDQKIYSTWDNDRAEVDFPTASTSVFNYETNTNHTFSPGNSITIKIDSSFDYDSGWSSHIYEETFQIQRDYANFTEWYNEIFSNRSKPASGDGGNYLGRTSVSTSGGLEYLNVTGLESGGSGGRGGFVDVWVTIRKSKGDFIFETEPVKDSNSYLFYETEQVFDIENGLHKGNLQNQTSSQSCIVDLDFFNCFSQGNGVESYLIKDAFNKQSLNIDSRPSSTSIEEYKEIRRYADLTYGEPYISSTNKNGLNEFNLSTANFSILDKNYGAITKLVSRENDIVVLQEEKASKVLFERDELSNADGSTNLVAVGNVLGRQITYYGENGCSNPEGVSVYNYQIYYPNAKRGVVQRLSIDGVTDIVYGMTSYFRNLFIERPNSIKIGGFDPYFKHYILSVGDEPETFLNVNCGNILNKTISEPFSYTFTLNNLDGDIVLNRNISSGTATISVFFDGNTTTQSKVSGLDIITIPRTSSVSNTVEINITPVTTSVTFEITHNCPVGIPMSIVNIVLGDENDVNKTITNRYNWDNSVFFESLDTLTNGVSKFEKIEGIEGMGPFPKRGKNVKIQSYKKTLNTGSFLSDEANRIGYLVTSTLYNQSDINTILNNATFLTTTETTVNISEKINEGSFSFSRTNNDILYMIWDYTNNYIPTATVTMPTDMNVDVSSPFNIYTFQESIIFNGYSNSASINYKKIKILYLPNSGILYINSIPITSINTFVELSDIQANLFTIYEENGLGYDYNDAIIYTVIDEQGNESNSVNFMMLIQA